MFGSKFQAWTVKQRGNPRTLIFSAICFSISLGIGYHYLYKPYARRIYKAEAEEYARIIYENEARQRSTSFKN